HTRSTRDWSSDVCSSDLAVAREGAIPAGGVAQADDEIVGVHHLTFDLLARGKRDNGGAARTIFAAARIKHARFEIDRRIFADDEIGRASCRGRRVNGGEE